MTLCAVMLSRGGFRLPSFSGVVCVHVLTEFQAGPYLHDQARGISRYFPRPLFLYSMQSISMPYTPKLHKRPACAAYAAASPKDLAAAPHCIRCLDGLTRDPRKHDGIDPA